MPHYSQTRIVPYTADQMYGIVADVERYPDFLPWCSRLDVLERRQEGTLVYLTAEMFVTYHGLNEHYTSLVKLDKPALSVEATHVKGPFRKLDNRWSFRPMANGTEVRFFIDFAFKSTLLTAVAGVAFGMVAARMADAFMRRADSLYGSGGDRRTS